LEGDWGKCKEVGRIGEELEVQGIRKSKPVKKKHNTRERRDKEKRKRKRAKNKALKSPEYGVLASRVKKVVWGGKPD